MDRSAYLVQALQGLQDTSQLPAQPGPDLAQMGKVRDARRAFEQANPGQSYIGHGFAQMGRNLRQAPDAVMQAPGNAVDGLRGLAGLFRAAPR